MNNMALVSVIIPTYGIPVFLDRSIESVQRQTISDWELIIVDDNNPDTEARTRTEECVNKFTEDKRIKYVQHEKNKNGAAARNTGISLAQGKYIAFLDSDDFYVNTRLEVCLKTVENSIDPTVGGVYTGCEFRRGGKVYHIEKNVKAGNYLCETLACTFVFCTGSNIFMKAEIVKELMFDERFLRHQDYEFLVRFFEKYTLLAIPDVFVIKNNENFNVPNSSKLISIKELYLQKYEYIIRSFDSKRQSVIYQAQYLQIVEAAIRTSDYKTARQYYSKAKEYRSLNCKQGIRLLLLFIKNMNRPI